MNMLDASFASAALKLRLLRQGLSRYWRIMTLAFLLTAVATTIAVYARRPSFQSNAAVLVDVQRHNVSASRADVRQDVAVLTAVEAVNSQAEVFRSRTLIEKVVDRLGPHAFDLPPARNILVRAVSNVVSGIGTGFGDLMRALQLLPPRNERYAMIKQIENGLEVSAVRQAQVVRLSFRGPTPESARTVLAELLNVERATNRNTEGANAELLRTEANRLKGELEQAEKKLFALQRRYRIADLAAEKTTITDRLNKLIISAEGAQDPESRDLTSALSPAANTPQAAGGAATGQSLVSSSASAEVSRNASASQLSQLRSQITALRVERSGLLAKFSPELGRVREIDSQIAAAQQLLQKEIAALLDTVNGYRARLDVLLQVEPELTSMQRTVALLNSSFEVYKKAAEDRQIMSIQDARDQIEVIESPSTPYEPTGPNRAMLFGGGLLLSAVVALGLGLLLAFLERSRMLPIPRRLTGEVRPEQRLHGSRPA